jgi:hypothetical protein
LKINLLKQLKMSILKIIILWIFIINMIKL